MKKLKDIITRENIVDMAWKAEGLDKILESQGQRVELRDLLKAYDIALLPPNHGANPGNDEIVEAYRTMKFLTDSYNHDSGKRKFNSL